MAAVIGYTHNGKEVSPSLIAAERQGVNNKTYYNVDVYTDRLLPKGQRIVQLTFEGAAKVYDYFLPYEQFQEIVAKHGLDARVFADKWQIAPFYDRDTGLAQGKTKAIVLEVQSPVIVGQGPTRANTHLGSGEGMQIHMPLADEIYKKDGLKIVEEYKLTDFDRNLGATEALLQEAEINHKSMYGPGKFSSKYEKGLDLHKIPIEKAPEQFKAPSLFDTAEKTGKALTGPARELAPGVADTGTVYWNPDIGPVQAPVQEHPYKNGRQQPDSIGARPNIHGIIMNMQKLEQEQEELKKERDQHKGEPLSREKAEQLAKTSYVTGEDERLAQQIKALQAERTQLQKDEMRHRNFGREHGVDGQPGKYIPNWLKSHARKIYEYNAGVIEEKKQDLDQRESEIAAKTEKLQERLQTPEARAAINEKARQYLAQDAERLTKLEHIDTKIGQVQKEMINNIQQATGLPEKQGSHSPEQSMAAWRRITDIMNAEPRPKMPGTEKLLMGEVREYRIQAKAIIEREGYWPGQAADAEIAGSMYMKGYAKERVSLAFMKASPETVNNTISQKIQYGRDIAAQALTPAIQNNLPSHDRSLSIY